MDNRDSADYSVGNRDSADFSYAFMKSRLFHRERTPGPGRVEERHPIEREDDPTLRRMTAGTYLQARLAEPITSDPRAATPRPATPAGTRRPGLGPLESSRKLNNYYSAQRNAGQNGIVQWPGETEDSAGSSDYNSDDSRGSLEDHRIPPSVFKAEDYRSIVPVPLAKTWAWPIDRFNWKEAYPGSTYGIDGDDIQRGVTDGSLVEDDIGLRYVGSECYMILKLQIETMPEDLERVEKMCAALYAAPERQFQAENKRRETFSAAIAAYEKSGRMDSGAFPRPLQIRKRGFV